MTLLSTGLPLAERYLLIEQLGAGGMSVVWRGFDDVLGRPVAVKVLSPPTAADPAFRAAIRREARASARLSHPNITQVYDYGEAEIADGETISYVVMELLSGETLGQRLVHGPLPWPEAVHVAAQVADALTAAHRRGIVHRDIAPANVMLSPTGAKVLDFGIAALAGGRGDPDGGGLLGTPAYVAPERLGDAPAAPSADVYSLGALLYEMLTGATPVPARTWPALVEAYKTNPSITPLRLPGLPPEVADLVIRCLSPDSADRPSTADAARVLGTARAQANAAQVTAARSRATHAEQITAEFPAPARAVLSPTQTLLVPVPLLESQVEPPASTRRPRILVVGIALAVAIFLLVGTLLITDRGDGSGDQKATGPLASPTNLTNAVAGVPPATGVPTASPHSAPPVAGATQSPSQPSPSPSTANTLAVVQTMLTQVDDAGKLGEIRSDAALDLDNVLNTLRSDLISGNPVDVPHYASYLRQKINDRLREQALTPAVATELLSTVDKLAPVN